MNLFDSNVGISEWYSVLNWDFLPDFGPCHHHAASGEIEEFMQRYVMTDELKRFCGTISEKLESRRIGQPVVMLEGNPGLGKTTLIYSLSAHVTSSSSLNQSYVFYACHANNIDNEGWEYEVLYHIKQALKQLFNSCSQKSLYNKICTNENDCVNGLRK